MFLFFAFQILLIHTFYTNFSRLVPFIGNKIVRLELSLKTNFYADVNNTRRTVFSLHVVSYHLQTGNIGKPRVSCATNL